MDIMLSTLRAGLPGLGVTIPAGADETLCKFGCELVEQNKVMNLTAITEPEAVAKLHLLDCLTVLKCADLAGKKLIDVGCGAGFPGVPLKIGCPELDLTLLDSLGKRMNWLEATLPKLDRPLCQGGRRGPGHEGRGGQGGAGRVQKRDQTAGPEAGKGPRVPHGRHQSYGHRPAQGRPHSRQVPQTLRQDQGRTALIFHFPLSIFNLYEGESP